MELMPKLTKQNRSFVVTCLLPNCGLETSLGQLSGNDWNDHMSSVHDWKDIKEMICLKLSIIREKKEIIELSTGT